MPTEYRTAENDATGKQKPTSLATPMPITSLNMKLKIKMKLLKFRYKVIWLVLLTLTLGGITSGAQVISSAKNVLAEVSESDRSIRGGIDSNRSKYGMNSKQMHELWGRIKANDAQNIKTVTDLLDQYGWLNSEMVGADGEAAILNTLQRADASTQERYLRLLKTAVQAGKAKASVAAIMEDRIAISKGEMQIYGTQIRKDAQTGQYSLAPLRDPASVDTRRLSVGLGPISDFKRKWNIN
jgi:hypothetical protein